MHLNVRILTEDEFALWDRLVTDSPQHSIFAQRWWIDIVTHGEGKLLGCFAEQRLLGGIPIWPCVTLGVRYLRQPPLTPYWGPVLVPFEGSYQTRLNNEFSVLRAFAEALTAWQDVALQFHPSLDNWLTFYWNDFQQTTRYTYRIEQWPTRMCVEELCVSDVRNKLKKAQKCGLHIQDDIDPGIPVELSQQTMARQGQQSSHAIRRFWPELAEAARTRQCMFTTAAMDDNGQVCDAGIMLWDQRCAYGLFMGNDPRFRACAGGVLVQWRILEKAAMVAPAFDFEGSMIEGVERFMRAFGGNLTPYLRVTRAKNVPVNAARAVQRGWQHLRSVRKRPSF